MIDGLIYNMALPGRTHQRVSSKLHQTIANYIDGQKGDCEQYSFGEEVPVGIYEGFQIKVQPG